MVWSVVAVVFIVNRLLFWFFLVFGSVLFRRAEIPGFAGIISVDYKGRKGFISRYYIKVPRNTREKTREFLPPQSPETESPLFFRKTERTGIKCY